MSMECDLAAAYGAEHDGHKQGFTDATSMSEVQVGV